MLFHINSFNDLNQKLLVKNQNRIKFKELKILNPQLTPFHKCKFFPLATKVFESRIYKLVGFSSTLFVKSSFCILRSKIFRFFP